MNIFGFGKVRARRQMRESVTNAVISAADWEAMQADVRGLKRLAELEQAQRTTVDARLGDAIDKLEVIVAGAAEVDAKNTVELEARINRLTATVDRLARDLTAEQAARIAGDQRASESVGGDTFVRAGIPTVADVLAAAPAPNVEEMRAYYAGKRAEKEVRERAAAESQEGAPAQLPV